MSVIDSTFTELKKRKEGAFMPFLVIGDPDIEQSLALTRVLIKEGADFLEFGFPYSDPPADGPVIQAASKRALKHGLTTADAFEFLRTVRREFDGPIVLLLYYNLIFKKGIDAFYREASDAGVDGILVADVPLEEAKPLVNMSKETRIDQVFIAAPSSSDQRLESMGQQGAGFIYGVTRVGITGEQNALSHSLQDNIQRFKTHTQLPCLAGFGISTPDHVKGVLRAGADGAICGSAIIRRIEENLGDPSKMLSEVAQFSSSMKQATRHS